MNAPSGAVRRRARPAPAIIPIAAVLALAAVTGVHGFVSARNISNIGLQASILLMISMPMTLAVMSEGLDLSAGAVLSLCSVVLAQVLAAAT